MSARAKGLVVAIDGPAGAGKTSVSQRVAKRLGYTLVDTGALYRGIALAAREAGISWDDGKALGAFASKMDLAFASSEEGPRLMVNGRDRSGDIRTPEISQGASIVSSYPEVRAALLELQRKLGAEGGVVLEGRDIGTVVFPNAEVKVFLTASDQERARRRTDELRAKGTPAELQQVLAEMKERDTRDSSRPVAPLKPAADSVRLDSTGMTMDEVIEHIVELVRSRSR